MFIRLCYNEVYQLNLKIKYSLAICAAEEAIHWIPTQRSLVFVAFQSAILVINCDFLCLDEEI